MNTGSSAWLPLFLAAALAGLTWWLNHATTIADKQDHGGFSHTPDYFLDNFRATAFDANGQTLHVLRARHMVHYMDDDTTSLTEPRYEHHGATGPEVRVQARRGVVSGNGDHVHFLDDVRLIREADGGEALELRTSYLHVTPDAQQMQTHKPLVVQMGTSTLNASAMRADGKQRSMVFAGRVKGTYHVSR